MEPQRATQGFVANLAFVRQRPLLTLMEVAWRWCFGIAALLLIWREGSRVFDATPWRGTGIQSLSVNQLLTDPLGASETIANFATLIAPGLYHAAVWLGPLLLIAWAVLSGLGRTAVLRRMDGTLRARPATLIVLQMVRLVPLVTAFALWWTGLQSLANRTILQPIAAGGEPQMMLYVGGAIVLSLGLFVLSAGVGWVFNMAPLLAMMHDTGPLRSLRDAARIGGVRSGLVEINMVLGIVKIALLVLAMVFSACPLPFQSVMTDEFLFWWNVAVAVWYFLASDFFHVARLSSYLRLWRATAE